MLYYHVFLLYRNQYFQLYCLRRLKSENSKKNPIASIFPLPPTVNYHTSPPPSDEINWKVEKFPQTGSAGHKARRMLRVALTATLTTGARWKTTRQMTRAPTQQPPKASQKKRTKKNQAPSCDDWWGEEARAFFDLLEGWKCKGTQSTLSAGAAVGDGRKKFREKLLEHPSSEHQPTKKKWGLFLGWFRLG